MKRTRFLAPALAALLAASAFAQQQNEIIVESFSDGQNASAFEPVEGKWFESISKSKAPGVTASKAMFKALGQSGGARFKLPVPADGKFDVYVTFPGSANASGVIYVVTHAGGKTEVVQDQFGRGNDPGTPVDSWIPLGTFEFKQGGDNSVEVRDPGTGIAPDVDEPNKRVYADAVRVVPNTGTPLTAAASKLAGAPPAAAAAPAAPAVPAAPSTPAPDLPGLAAAVATPAEGLPSLAAAVATASSALPGLSAASSAPAPADAAASGLPGLQAATAPAAAPAAGLPGLQAATAPDAAAAPAGLPGLQAATASDAAATPAAGLPGLQAATAPPVSATPAAALPALTEATPSAGLPALPAATAPAEATPALPLLGAPSTAPAAPPTTAPMETPAAVGLPGMPSVAELPIGLPPIPTAPTVAETPASVATPPAAATPAAQVANISWAYDIGAAQAAAETGDKRILVFMTARGNRVGMKYETEYFNDPAVRSQIDHFVPLKLDFPTSTRYAYKLGLMGAGKLVVIDRAETVLLMVDQIPPSAAEFAKMLEGVK